MRQILVSLLLAGTVVAGVAYFVFGGAWNNTSTVSSSTNKAITTNSSQLSQTPTATAP